MLHSLNTKLVLAFLLVSLIGIILAGAYVWWTTTNEFSWFVATQNQEAMADRVREAYVASGGWARLRRWQDIELYASSGSVPGSEERVGPPISTFTFSTIVDAQRMVVIAGRGHFPGQRISLQEYNAAAPITVEGQEVGRLLLEYRPSPEWRAASRFMKSFYTALGVGALGGTLIALLLGVLLARSLTSPLRRIARAAQAMSAGQLDQEIKVTSQDELGELASSFNQLSDDLVEAQELRKQMTADIAHELRTPLSLILGHAEGLADGVLRPTRETFDIIHDEAVRLSRLVEDLRILSLFDAGELSLRRQATSPAILLRDAMIAHKADAERQGVQLLLDLEEDLSDIMADADRIGQVLHNLISNALRYTPEGGTIRLSGERHPDGVKMTVSDNGSGIDPEDLSHLFERFYRADRARQRVRGGSGLGLAIVRSIIDQHGGVIWAESEPGDGARFVFTLPIADPEKSVSSPEDE